MADQEVRIGHEQLACYCADLLKAVGVPAADAELTAKIQVEADLRGVYSHGSRAIPRYADTVRRGAANPHPNITATAEGPAFALLDGDHGLGQVVSHRAMSLAIEKAKTTTIAAVGVQRSNHFGAAAYYSVMAAEAGMVGFSTSTSGGANQAAYGGTNPIVGNSPFSFALPAGEEHPIVLDMATGASAHGKIVLAKMAGKLLPPGYFMTSEGEDTTDPNLAKIVMPAAGPKGYGLALTMDILGGVMLGDVASCHKNRRDPNLPIESGHFFWAVNIASFRPLAEYRAEVDRQIRTIRASKTRPGVEQVLLPGEPEWLKKEEQLENGVALHVDIVSALTAYGKELGVEPCWES